MDDELEEDRKDDFLGFEYEVEPQVPEEIQLNDPERLRGWALRPTPDEKCVVLYQAKLPQGSSEAAYHCHLSNTYEEIQNLITILREYRDKLA